MSVVVPRDSTSGSPYGHDVPLAVSGTVSGRRVEALVTGLLDVLTQIVAWTDEDPAAVGSWGLREDYSEPLVMPVRRRAGSVPVGGRATHLLSLLPGEPQGHTITALCGERMPLVGVDPAAVGDGMPCEPCLGRQVARVGLPAARDGRRVERRGLQRAIKHGLDRQIG